MLSGASVCRLLAASTTRWSRQTWYYHVCLTFSRFSKNVPQVVVVVVLFLKKGAKDTLTVWTNSPDVRKVWHLLFWKVCWNTLDIWIWKSALCDFRIGPNTAPGLVTTTPAIFSGVLRLFFFFFFFNTCHLHYRDLRIYHVFVIPGLALHALWFLLRKTNFSQERLTLAPGPWTHFISNQELAGSWKLSQVAANTGLNMLFSGDIWSFLDM